MRRASRDILPGVVDAGLSSLATFVTGLYAARYLPPTLLGGYALVMSAFVLMTKVPALILFRAAENEIVSLPPAVRLLYIWQTLRLSVYPVVLSALAIVFWIVVRPPGLPADAVLAMTATAILAAVLSPVQDHVRRMLHMGDGSWHAAGVSAVQCLAAGGAVAVLVAAGVASYWVPFSALAVANGVSLIAGLIWARRPHSPLEVRLHFSGLVRSGTWLLLIGLMPLAAGFVAGVIVSHLAGAASLGYAEAGRVLGQPPFVLSVGLGAVLGPRSMAAARAGNYAEARRISRIYALVSLLCGLPYLLLVGFAWKWNPVHHVLPNAYAVSGLVSATILGNLLIGMDWPYRSELIGAGRETSLARLEGSANAARIAVAATAPVTGAFAIPAGLVTMAAVRSIGYRITLRRVWRGRPRR